MRALDGQLRFSFLETDGRYRIVVFHENPVKPFSDDRPIKRPNAHAIYKYAQGDFFHYQLIAFKSIRFHHLIVWLYNWKSSRNICKQSEFHLDFNTKIFGFSLLNCSTNNCHIYFRTFICFLRVYLIYLILV